MEDTDQKPPLPRVLYSAFFSWLSVSCGRFIAPFLKHEAGFSDEYIGYAVALQIGISSTLGMFGSSWSDYIESKYPNRGRSYVILSGVFGATFFFILHGTWRCFPGVSFFQSIAWHMLLRCFYAVSMATVYPVLDGLTLAHLNEEPGREKTDYGKERLYGAIWWGATNLIMGPFIDWIGYQAMYLFAFISALASLYTVKFYVLGKISWQISRQRETTEIQSSDEGTTLLPIWILLRIMIGTVIAATFFISYFCLCTGFSVVENLNFLYFEYLGASNSLNGLTVALTVLFEIPIFHIAPKLLKHFGSSALLQIANVTLILRLIGYILVPDGRVHFVLFFEPLHGIILGCLQTASVDFVSQLMPCGHEASGQGLLVMFHGLAGILGLSLAGILEQNLGPRLMYRTLGFIVATGLAVFAVAGAIYGSKVERRLLSEVGDLEPLSSSDELPTQTIQVHKKYGSTS
mmetsp:Transcript_12433/g.19144  ORF Transcript_12433/g.19144 Transcript_12433/m.19144 type:complete len:461 (+) Transcript_12433:129-1511(+)